MGRQHVHFATHDPRDSKEIISGMRSTSEIMIYLNVPKALAAGMKLFRSSNSVLLTRGLGGAVKPDFFSQVVQRFPRTILWPEMRLGERPVPGLASAASGKQASNAKMSSSKHETSDKVVSKKVPTVLDSWEDEEDGDEEEEHGRDGATSLEPSPGGTDECLPIHARGNKKVAGTPTCVEQVQLGSEQRKNRFTSNVKQTIEQQKETRRIDLGTSPSKICELDKLEDGQMPDEKEQLRKELRALEKKLKQIQGLAMKQSQNHKLDDEALQKLGSKIEVECKVQQLQRRLTALGV